MLPFRRDRLYIGIEPMRVSFVRLQRGQYTNVASHQCFVVPAGHNPAELRSLLERELRSDRWQGTQLQVIFSDAMVRYFIAPVPSGARSIQELRQTAELRYEEIYGDGLDEWAVTVNLAPGASHNLGCAIRKDWVELIQHHSAETNIVLDGLQPFGVSEFNRHERAIGFRSGWFATYYNDTLWTAFKNGSAWLTTQVHHLPEPPVSQLSTILEREELRAGLSHRQTLFLWLAGQFSAAHPITAFKDIKASYLSAPTWAGQSETWIQTYRLALSPVWPVCA